MGKTRMSERNGRVGQQGQWYHGGDGSWLGIGSGEGEKWTDSRNVEKNLQGWGGDMREETVKNDLNN